MMPRAARVAATAAAAAGGGSEAAGAPKSNADFRAMMLSGFKKGADLETRAKGSDISIRRPWRA